MAQVTAKECKNTCKDQKKACVNGFKAQFEAAKADCSDNQCKKNAKKAFKANKKSCVKDPEGFKTCKRCCGDDDPSSCGIRICGDGQTVAPEECDAGKSNNSDMPDAPCRANCASRRCGDGIVDTASGEGCDAGANNSDTTPDACRTTCEPAHCGDRVQDTGEECDDPIENSDTERDVCRTNCQPPGCGDGVLDTGDLCDEGAANSNAPDATCRTDCKPRRCGDEIVDTAAGESCDDGAANSNTTPDACRLNCQPGRCGDGVKDAGEVCDGADDDACGVADCRANCTCESVDCGDGDLDAGEECDGADDAACVCPGTCLDDCLCARELAFTTVPPGGSCGRVNDDRAGTGTDLTPYGATSPQLDCGTLYIGGGGSVQPPSPTPDGATSIFKLDSCTDATSIVLSATTSADTGSSQSCTSSGCFFGPPLPIPNTGSTSVSTCVINRLADTPAAGGSLNAVAGESTTTIPLTVSVHVTGDLEPDPGIQPCPTCSGGTCQSGANSGGACTTITSLLSSHDCPPTQGTLAPFGVDLSPLTTGTVTRSADAGTDGNFCAPPNPDPAPGQRTNGAFGNPTANYIETMGVPAGDMTGGALLAGTQASVFCIPKSGSALVNTVADLPGPGAVTLKGSTRLTP
jgi:hypothetical protein